MQTEIKMIEIKEIQSLYYNTNKLQEGSICKQMYADRVKSKYKSLKVVKNWKWNTPREELVTLVYEIILRKETRKELVDSWNSQADGKETADNTKEWHRIYNEKHEKNASR